MEARFPNSLTRSNLLSFAQNIPQSKLINQSILSKSIIGANKANSKNTNANLLYANITHNKERSRSVNSMLNNLLKQSFVVKDSANGSEINQIKIKTNENLNDSVSDYDAKNENQTRSTRPSFINTNNTVSSDENNNDLFVDQDENRTMINSVKTMTSRYSTPSTFSKNEISSKFDNESNKQGNVIQIELEDLIVLEEKLSQVLESLRYGKPSAKLCIEWWNFSMYSSFNVKFENVFPLNTTNRNIVHESMILEVLSIVLLYESLKDQKISQSTLNNLKSLINEIHQSFLIIIDSVISKIISQSISNMWINKIQNIVLSKRTHRIYKNEHISVLKKNNAYIQTIIRIILRIYSSNKKIDIAAFNFYLKKISNVSIKALNDFFKKIVTIDCSKNGESLTFVITSKTSMPNISYPYLPSKTSNKVFTMVLDLDETLISFKLNETGKGMIIFRPGLDQFLNELSTLYEMVVFTAGTQEYDDPILDEIENTNKFFTKRLYRQHTVIIESGIVKDLSKLGRDLSKVVIIDNMPQNFRLQKENGIFIKNYYGEDSSDTALIDLIPILKEIASDPNNDVRVELRRLKNEIFSMITTNLNEEIQ